MILFFQNKCIIKENIQQKWTIYISYYDIYNDINIYNIIYNKSIRIKNNFF